MSAFTGPQGKGAMRRRREQKRAEAARRGMAVSHVKTKAHRLGRCEHGRAAS